MAKAKKNSEQMVCSSCGRKVSASSNFYKTDSDLFEYYGRVPICKKCIYEIFNKYLRLYSDNLKKATYYTCRKLDISFNNIDYEAAFKEYQYKDRKDRVFFGIYMTKHSSLGKINNGNATFDESDSIEVVSKVVVSCKKEEEKQKKKKKDNSKINEWSQEFELTREDKVIKKDVIKLMGRDVFAGYSKYDQKFLYADLIDYLDEDTVDDNYKLSKIIQLIVNDHQIRKYDYMISKVSSNVDLLLENSDKIKSLTGLKKNISDISDKIAKENAISVKNRGDKRAGKSTLTYLMKNYRELGFEDAETDYYNQKKAVGYKHASNISNKAILEQLQFDENDIEMILKEQRTLIKELQEKVADLEEENRILYKKNKT